MRLSHKFSLRKKQKNFNSFAKSFKKKHISAWEKECNRKLWKREPRHAFKTDVAQVVFGASRAKKHATMLSAMCVLQEAMSDELDIEKINIKGRLYKVGYENRMTYTIILYDGVADGADHVQRFVTDNCCVFQRIVRKAIQPQGIVIIIQPVITVCVIITIRLCVIFWIVERSIYPRSVSWRRDCFSLTSASRRSRERFRQIT